MIKDEIEISKIREASIIAAMTLDHIGPYVKEWVCTEDLDHICNAFIMKMWWRSACKGYHNYPKYTCISLNDTICHGIPSKNERLKAWDILNVDVTVVKDGYFGDTSRMYWVGDISPIARKLIEVTRKCLEIGIREVSPWKMTGEIWYGISRYAESQWFSVVREYTWHGIGRSFHEEPFIYHKSKRSSWVMMVPWMVFTIEPMINLGTYRTRLLRDWWTVKTEDGKISAQFEHTILVTGTWNEILTKA